jgi:circadian clock protein KaiC
LRAISHRCKTGAPGFDTILGGGLPRHRIYLLQGDPGVGKTTLGLQFLLEGAKQGESGLYIALSETQEELNEVATSHGWDLDKISLFELSALEEKLRAETDTTFFSPSEVELSRTTKALMDRVEEVKPTRVVFDSLSELRMLSETPLRYRRQILYLKQFFSGRKCTVLLLDDRTTTDADLQVESLAHGVFLLLKTAPAYGISRRQLCVQKVRGVKFLEGHHDIVLATGGMQVFPRLVAAEHQQPSESGTLASNVPGLDQLLGGGLDRGTSTMFMGPPGTGKSTLAMCFAAEAARRGEKALFYTFDETRTTLLKRAEALGMDVRTQIDRGLLQVTQIDPAEISPGEFVHRIQSAVLTDQVRVIIIDSINGYMNAMPEERFLSLQLHELLAFLNQRGVITIMVLAQQGLIGSMQSAVDLTYLADSVVLLRYFEAYGSVRQAISVIKKRSGDHERAIREIAVSKDGIKVGAPLTNFHGILSGIPVFNEDSEREEKARGAGQT